MEEIGRAVDCCLSGRYRSPSGAAGFILARVNIILLPELARRRGARRLLTRRGKRSWAHRPRRHFQEEGGPPRGGVTACAGHANARTTLWLAVLQPRPLPSREGALPQRASLEERREREECALKGRFSRLAGSVTLARSLARSATSSIYWLFWPLRCSDSVGTTSL